MSARQQILARLRGATVTNPPPLPDVASWFDSHRRHEELEQRTQRLRTALAAVHTELHDVTPANWASVLLQVAADKGVRQLLIGADTPHGAQLQACPANGVQLLTYSQPIDGWRETMFDTVDASLTLARGAVAETGSLLLWPSPSEPRLLSLVPPVHFVLLDVDAIYADLLSMMTAQGWSQGLPTNVLLICGPSKTADIQQTLAYGAHGPKELVVLLRHASGSAS